MRSSWKPTAAGTLVLGFLALPLAALLPRSTGVPAHAAVPEWTVPWPDTPSQRAMREASVWWAMAIQLAGEKQEEEHAVLLAWDPAAPSDEAAARQHLLGRDEGGNVERAMAAARKAQRLARTPAERRRAQEKRRQWEVAIGRRGHSTRREATIIGVDPPAAVRAGWFPLRRLEEDTDANPADRR